MNVLAGIASGHVLVLVTAVQVYWPELSVLKRPAQPVDEAASARTQTSKRRIAGG